MPRDETYRFESRWRVPAPADAGTVYDVLQDVAGYPTWWRSVPYVIRLDDDVALVGCRSRLPKTLEIELRPIVQDRSAGLLEASLARDLVGWSRFELAESTGGGVEVTYSQEVTTPGKLMRMAGRFGRSVLEWNHEQMMIALREDLESALR